MQRIYAKAPEPKVVVAVGNCPLSGDVFNQEGGSVYAPASDFIPVDAEISGCPPRPSEILAAILAVGPDAIATKGRQAKGGHTVEEKAEGGKSMILPIGPIHPALKEPLRLKLKTQGEKVLEAEIDYGYVHRGIERVMRGKTWQKGIFLSERVCGICSYIHTQTFAETFESIAGEQVPLRAQFLRVLTNELDRIQSHLLANSTYFKALEHETLFMYMLHLREPIMDAIELLTGNRVNMGWNIVGGVKMDVNQSHLDSIMKIILELEDQYDRYVEMFNHGPLVGIRSHDVGKMTREEAIKARAVGPIGRASGLKHDLREQHHTYHDHFDFKVIWRKEQDNYARTMNRFDEVTESIKIIKQAIENLPPGEIRKQITIPAGYG